MVITVSLVNFRHHTQLQIIFLVMRNFKIDSLINLQICNILPLAIVTMLCITSPELIYFTTGSLYLLTDLAFLIWQIYPKKIEMWFKIYVQRLLSQLYLEWKKIGNLCVSQIYMFWHINITKYHVTLEMVILEDTSSPRKCVEKGFL